MRVCIFGSGVRESEPLEDFTPVTALHLTALFIQLIEDRDVVGTQGPNGLHILNHAVLIFYGFHNAPTLAAG